MKRTTTFLSLLALSAGLLAQSSVKTERQYLSGRGCDDMVQWDFMCTGGNNSGKWTKIGVPSCWELQGFGTYQYGMKFYGKAFPEGVADEQGLYKYEFELPAEWNGKQIELVFEGSMTDTQVKINGRKAGSMHQGAFYRFIYNVSDRVFFGSKKKNVLEVTVSKESANAGVNLAERRADYWNFGGIFRPVFIVAKPAQNIDRLAIDAKADGNFYADCFLNMAVEGARIHTVITDVKGKKVAENTSDVRTGSDHASINFTVKSPELWTAETPTMYQATFTLLDKAGKTLHVENQKFGFRTIETRESDGLYINGQRVMIKGVNRHSFRPESGRTLSKAKNIEDVLLIKSMNMNAVRLSHYPADPEFFEACDSLGLYVMDELSGWHGKHETINGQKLVKEMITRDVNHPCIIWWSNGNEKGWNTELDGEFHKYDPQKRPVLHPKATSADMKHALSFLWRKPELYASARNIYADRILDGLYDGGHGAGLYDYWEMMRKHPRCAGGFLWVLADEGVKRVDMNGFIDNCGNYGADGIVGPHHEKEGSYFTIKQVWCPIQIRVDSLDSQFDGKLRIENRYDFLNANTCRFTYKYVQLPSVTDRGGMKVMKQGEVNCPDIPAHGVGTLTIPAAMKGANALLLTVTDKNGNDLFTWSYKLEDIAGLQQVSAGNKPSYKETADALTVDAGGRTFTFSQKDGQLKGVKIGSRTISLTNGPRFIAAKRSDRSMDQFYNHDDKEAEKKKTQYTTFEDAGCFTGFSVREEGNNVVVTANYKLGCFDQAVWTISPDGTAAIDFTYNFSGVVDLMGVMFDYPEDKVLSKRWVGDGPYRVWQNRLHGPQLGVWENEYNDPIPAESFTYPEFKGYFANVQWMTLETQEGMISICNRTPQNYVGVYQPRDGRDGLLYTFPVTGISLMKVIPPVRNKVNTTDLIGPSSQAFWADGEYGGGITLKFE